MNIAAPIVCCTLVHASLSAPKWATGATRDVWPQILKGKKKNWHVLNTLGMLSSTVVGQIQTYLATAGPQAARTRSFIRPHSKKKSLSKRCFVRMLRVVFACLTGGSNEVKGHTTGNKSRKRPGCFWPSKFRRTFLWLNQIWLLRRSVRLFCIIF